MNHTKEAIHSTLGDALLYAVATVMFYMMEMWYPIIVAAVWGLFLFLRLNQIRVSIKIDRELKAIREI